MRKFVAYTDASCQSPDSAWGYLIVSDMPNEDLATKDPSKIGPFVSHGHGILRNTTNNQGELTAILKVIQCLSRLATDQHCVIVADSLYAINSIEVWRPTWTRRKFVGVKNLEYLHPLWAAFDALQEKCHVSFLHVRGHQGIVGNEYVDGLSRAMFSLSPKHHRRKLKDSLWNRNGKPRGT